MSSRTEADELREQLTYEREQKGYYKRAYFKLLFYGTPTIERCGECGETADSPTKHRHNACR